LKIIIWILFPFYIRKIGSVTSVLAHASVGYFSLMIMVKAKDNL